jgi:hypothetical protein
MSAVRVRLSPARELSGYYDSTEGCQFVSSIYDFTFMDVDKILPFSSTLGWHSLNVNGEVQKRKGLRWIPRHPETRKGVASDEMLRGVENKLSSQLTGSCVVLLMLINTIIYLIFVESNQYSFHK